MNYKMFLAVTFLVVAQLTIASAQSLSDIAEVTAQIEKDPRNPMLASLYIKRGFLYTWNGSFSTKPAVDPSKISEDVDRNRANALADAERAIKKGENYKAYYLRGLVKTSLRKYDEAEKDFKAAGKLKAEYPIVANVYQVDTSGGKVVYPYDLQYVNPTAVIFYGSSLGRLNGFDTLAAAKEIALNIKKSLVIRRDKQTNKFFLHEAFITDNVPINVSLAETPFGKAAAGKTKLQLTYEALKISSDHTVQRLPKEAEVDRHNSTEIVDMIDADGLTLIKKTNMQLMAGSKGIRLLFDSELAAGNFNEALKIYDWFDKRNTANSANDLDIVKITRKTNLSKIYQYAQTLRPFVEKEVTRWNYSDADKAAVRGSR
ncbi:MAG: hypothetical protein PSX80_16615 [bacterium]|nr:hypothetical protein [bacterium]